MTYRLGILDQSRLADDDNQQGALQATIRHAEEAEEWVYDRFWVSEHHGKEELAGRFTGNPDELFAGQNKNDPDWQWRCSASAL